ncbi:MAG: pyridoxamine 5'-phosphate oxidase family protein [Bdellovibrionales bacterium]|nr:pyridoxamine 5'-phosphate oxidase family protein [Bdellovibrionales bacterium]
MNTKDQVERLYDILGDFSTGMLCTLSASGRIGARPMAVAAVSEAGEILLVTADDSRKVHEVEEQQTVCFTCQGDSRFLSLNGRARVSKNVRLLKELWNPQFQAWFPEGPEDSSAVLLVVTPERGEYWDSSGIQKVAYVYETAKAYATGTTPDVSSDEQHAKVSM